MENNSKFKGITSYNADYVITKGERPEKIIPKGSIILGNNNFEGLTNYLNDYY